MNAFNEKFPGILLAYLNDTCYTLDNSECNELSKFVEGLIDELAAVKAERDALQVANRTYAISVCPELDRTIAELQAERNTLKERIKELETAYAWKHERCAQFVNERDAANEEVLRIREIAHEFEAELARVTAERDALREAARWIAVGERLPMIDGFTDILLENGVPSIAWFERSCGWWGFLTEKPTVVTHWRELPTPEVQS